MRAEGLLENRIGESVSTYQNGLSDPVRVTGITDREARSGVSYPGQSGLVRLLAGKVRTVAARPGAAGDSVPSVMQ